MRWQDFLVMQTQKALGDLIRAVEAIPEEKRNWNPAEGPRSALDQFREVAIAPELHFAVIESGEMPPRELHVALMRRAKELHTFDEMREYARESTAKLCTLISSYPDEELEKEISLDFGGQSTWRMSEVLGLHYWNTVYHLGQVNYIQTMLGDRGMH